MLPYRSPRLFWHNDYRWLSICKCRNCLLRLNHDISLLLRCWLPNSCLILHMFMVHLKLKKDFCQKWVFQFFIFILHLTVRDGNRRLGFEVAPKVLQRTWILFNILYFIPYLCDPSSLFPAVFFSTGDTSLLCRSTCTLLCSFSLCSFFPSLFKPHIHGRCSFCTRAITLTSVLCVPQLCTVEATWPHMHQSQEYAFLCFMAPADTGMKTLHWTMCTFCLFVLACVNIHFIFSCSLFRHVQIGGRFSLLQNDPVAFFCIVLCRPVVACHRKVALYIGV